jgi:hypothetical protein
MSVAALSPVARAVPSDNWALAATYAGQLRWYWSSGILNPGR